MADLAINPQEEIKKISTFISETLKKNGKKKLIVAVSGGVDSSVTLSLSLKAVGGENVFALSLPYASLNPDGKTLTKKLFVHLNISEKYRETIDIKKSVDNICTDLKIPEEDIVRKGNIIARARMIYLYDRAKKYNGFVCGTENKSEYLLGYFTRFGDEASDLEPIRSLYKTQVYEVAKELGLPQEIISQKPTAGLWEGQSDEVQLGFSYVEADQVLALHFDDKIPFEDISLSLYPHRDLIKKVVLENNFKHEVPYLRSGR